ncbi:MAG: hypothetical protein J3K34DRAFT_442899 [Monoraphidium minutum]|nr:MAG: hypothetical protein J3K34DRAFT_442899 [Monoraphidium minutum]
MRDATGPTNPKRLRTRVVSMPPPRAGGAAPAATGSGAASASAAPALRPRSIGAPLAANGLPAGWRRAGGARARRSGWGWAASEGVWSGWRAHTQRATTTPRRLRPRAPRPPLPGAPRGRLAAPICGSRRGNEGHEAGRPSLYYQSQERSGVAGSACRGLREQMGTVGLVAGLQ